MEDGQEGLEVDSAGWVWLGHREGPQSLEVVCLGHWQGFRERRLGDNITGFGTSVGRQPRWETQVLQVGEEAEEREG